MGMTSAKSHDSTIGLRDLQIRSYEASESVQVRQEGTNSVPETRIVRISF
jgi:hypothetical protein